MIHYKKLLLICAMLLVFMVMLGCKQECKQRIAISGSTTLGTFIKSTAESFEKSHRVKINISASGSLKGLTALLEGKSDIADSSVKMPADQLWDAQKKGIKVKEFLIGYDIIVPIIHPTNNVKNLFMGQLSDIFTGLLTRWKDVEGNQGNIIVVDRKDNSGTKLVMSERFFESKKIAAGSIKRNNDRDVVSYIARHPAALGYISKSCFNKKVKAININGFIATKENVEKGYYPIYRELYLYVNETSYKGEIKSFIEFIMGTSGQDLLQKAGFFPLSRMNKPSK
jgi:phosphate transport system substrate-binding protein